MAERDDSISREKLYDSRIAQPPSRYAVNVGGSQVTVTPFRSVTQTSSSLSFTCNVPSQTVFLDRAVELQATVNFRFDVKCGSAQPANINEPIFVFGRDGALQALPVHGLISTLTVILNDSSVTLDLSTTMRELLRLTDYAANRRIRTAPTILDKYQSNASAPLLAAVNDPNGGWGNAIEADEVPNGAWWNIQFCDPASGTAVTPGGTYPNPGATAGLPNPVPVNANGVPCRLSSATGNDNGAGFYYGLGIIFTTAEFLMASPLIFADSHEESVGIFGLNNFQVTATLKSDTSRTIRNTITTTYARTIGQGAGGTAPYNFGVAPGLISANPFGNCVLNATFISPSINQRLPSTSMVPWAEYPRYVTTYSTSIPARGTAQIISQSLTIPVVPDLMVWYCKPQAQPTPQQGDYYLPITAIQLSFDNAAGLLSTTPATQLYRISQQNGLQMDYNQWYGEVVSSSDGSVVPLTGGFLVLRPGINFALSAGIASGVSGNFVVQAQVTVRNQTAAAVPSASLYLMCINSGFFATLAGSSRVMRNLLTESDVVNSPAAPENDVQSLKRYTGGGFLSSLGNILSKGVGVAKNLAPIASALKPLLPDSGMLGHLKSGMSAVGLGHAGGGGAGGGRRHHAGSLSSRLV
jgi:hypothetical protein